MPVLVEELSSTNDSSPIIATNDVKIESINDTHFKTSTTEDKVQAKPIYTGPRFLYFKYKQINFGLFHYINFYLG